MKKRFLFLWATLLVAALSFAQTSIDFGTNVKWYYEPELKVWYFELDNTDYTMQLVVTPKSTDNPMGVYTKEDFNTTETWLYDRTSYNYAFPSVINATLGYDIMTDEVYATVTMTDTDSKDWTITARRAFPTGALGTVNQKCSDFALYDDYYAVHGYYYYDAYTIASYSVSLYGYGPDKTGTFKIGQNARAFLHDGTNEIWIYSGSFTVTEKDGDYFLTGELIGFDDYKYPLDMKKLKPEIPDYDVLKAEGYDVDYSIVMCVNFAYQGKACNDVYFIGSFTDWDLQKLYKFEPLKNYPGWYVAQAPADNGIYNANWSEVEGKPVMVNEKGELDWNYQAGDQYAWTHMGGDVATVGDGYTDEVKIVYPYAGTYIYRMDYWKLHVQPCLPETPVCEYQLMMNDSYGDGWNNAYLQVEDGYYAEKFTITYGERYKAVTIPYYGNEPTFTWWTGSYDDECSFTLASSNGAGIFTQNGCKEFANGQEIYKLKLSPCASGENPYSVTNVTATVIDNNGLKIAWDKKDGVTEYSVTILDPDGSGLVSNAYTKSNLYNYTAYSLVQSGKYTITIASLDKDGQQLGATTVTPDIVLPTLTNVTISLMYTPDVGVEAPDGFWLMWGSYGQAESEYTKVKMNTSDKKLYTATINPNSTAYSFYVMNEENPESSTVRRSYGWYNQTVEEHCNMIPSYYASGQFSLMRYYLCEEIKYHDYRIKSCSASTVPGSMTFSWTAEDIADDYRLYVYEYDPGTDTKTDLTDFYVSGKKNSYVWGIDDAYDGKIVKWSIAPSNPISMPEVEAEGQWTLAKGSVTNTSLSATTKDNKSIDAEWTYSSTDLHYQVEVQYGGLAVKREVVTTTKYHYDAYFKGDYTVSVRPMTTSDVVCGPWTTSTGVTLDECPDAITDLAGVAGKDNVTFSWSTSLPRVYWSSDISVNGKWDYLGSGETDQKSVVIPASVDGMYYIYLEPMIEVEPGDFQRLSYFYYEATTPFFTSKTYHLTATTTKGGKIWPENATNDYGEGYELYLSAYPEVGYSFVKWSDGELSASRDIVITSDTAIQAIFAPLVNLTLTSTAGGSINVYSNYEWKSGDVYSYANGATASLVAIPDVDYKFNQWSDGVKTLTREIVMDKDLALEAQFEAAGTTPQFYIYVYSEDDSQGSIKDNSGYYYEGTTIVLEATPKAGYDFSEWSDGNKDNPREFTVTADANIMASFKEKVVKMSVSAGKGGTVSPEGDFTYPYGEIIVLTATAGTDYAFANWSDGNVMAERQVKLTQDTILVANFVSTLPPTPPVTYEFTVTAGEGGTVTQSKPNGTYEVGTIITVEAQPNTGFEFDKWEDGVTTATRVITITDKDVTIKALFKEQSGTPSTYTLTISSAGGGKVNEEKNGTYTAGEKVTIVATPNTDWTFVKWSDEVTTATREITMNSDVTLIAYFATSKKFEVTIKVDGDGGKVKPAYNKELVLGGTSIDIEAIPNEDYKFIEWSDGNTEAKRTVVITQDTVLKATFEEIVYVTLYVEVNNENWGTVLFDGKTISSMKKTVESGTTIKLTAEAEAGYMFSHYEEDGRDDVTDSEYAVKMTKKRTITAVFKKKPQGLDEMQAEGMTVKVIRDGQMYILRGGKVYTAQGQLVE